MLPCGDLTWKSDAKLAEPPKAWWTKVCGEQHGTVGLTIVVMITNNTGKKDDLILHGSKRS